MTSITVDGIELWNDLDAVLGGLLGWLADVELELADADSVSKPYWEQQAMLANRAIAAVTKWKDIGLGDGAGTECGDKSAE